MMFMWQCVGLFKSIRNKKCRFDDERQILKKNAKKESLTICLKIKKPFKFSKICKIKL